MSLVARWIVGPGPTSPIDPIHPIIVVIIIAITTTATRELLDLELDTRTFVGHRTGGTGGGVGHLFFAAPSTTARLALNHFALVVSPPGLAETHGQPV